MKLSTERSQLRNKSQTELTRLLAEAEQSLFKSRMEVATKQSKQHAALPATRRRIARLRTIIKERSGGQDG